MIEDGGYPPAMIDELLLASLALGSFDEPPRVDAAALFAERCALCHVLSGRGNVFGPDLSDAGLRYTKAQIVESIEEPSKTIAEGYEYVELALKDGRLEYGVLAPESAGKVILRQPGGITKRFEKDSIARRQTLPVSGMTLFTEKLAPEQIDALADWLLEWKIPVAREKPAAKPVETRGVPTWFVVGAGAVSALIAAYAVAAQRRRSHAAP
jgi:putative heme-binding domain-containing protein